MLVILMRMLGVIEIATSVKKPLNLDKQHQIMSCHPVMMNSFSAHKFRLVGAAYNHESRMEKARKQEELARNQHAQKLRGLAQVLNWQKHLY